MTDGEFSFDASEGSDPNSLIDVPVDQAIDEVFGGEQSDGAASLDGAEADVEKIKKERDEYLDTLLRLQAEFENFRKRTTRQQTDLLERASLSLVERLLPVLDALDLALLHMNDQKEGDSSSALVQIAGLAHAILEKEGLERIDETDVKFDPTIHDAVSQVKDDETVDHEPTVIDVMRAGYRLKGKVIRPAMVAVKG